MINLRTRCIGPFLLLTLPLLAADQVVLTNGDIITGAIVGKDGATLTLKSEFLGNVSVPWKAVKSIRSDVELNVVLPSGETVKGRIASDGDRLQVASTPAPVTAPLADIKAVRDDAGQHAFERMLHPGIFQLWSGTFDLGFALARGNARSDTLTTAFNASRESRTDKVGLYFTQIHSTARANNVTNTIASAVRGGWKYNRNLSPRFFLTGFNDYEHDGFQNLDLRFVAGGGAGIKAVKSERTQVDVDTGFDYQRENFFAGLHRNSAEVNFGDNLSYAVSKGTSVTQSMRFFTNVSGGGSYRLNFDIGSSTVLKKWLGWHVTASERLVSNPVQGRQRNDLLISTGFHLAFAR
jgi:putative salt-induced outer membrane protein YdiY